MPKSVRIGTVRYRVHCDPETTKKTREFEKMEWLQGRYKSVESSIVIADDLAPDNQQETLMHEVIHGIIWHAGLEDVFKKGADEGAVQAIALCLLNLLRDNPDLIAYLVSDGSAVSE